MMAPDFLLNFIAIATILFGLVWSFKNPLEFVWVVAFLWALFIFYSVYEIFIGVTNG